MFYSYRNVCDNVAEFGYKDFGMNIVDITVIVSFNTSVKEMPAPSEITITAKATQLAAPSATTNP